MTEFILNDNQSLLSHLKATRYDIIISLWEDYMQIDCNLNLIAFSTYMTW